MVQKPHKIYYNINYIPSISYFLFIKVNIFLWDNWLSIKNLYFRLDVGHIFFHLRIDGISNLRSQKRGVPWWHSG